ncbi:hypothetical protein SAMN02745166_01839 [Prosthecobacter debontii]|uniref:Fimbrial assembly protein (PilN) n=1 Tax=Prosthecobacter debontii TaxID=48467 RepID=A0A1T4XSP5_9BACT|nr:hypothetical protein [Prosthecobacter debontii]SKA92095.1 hypothetical protein SAMN02745166_01839 [Prosthecobacter debontii]
MSEYICHDFKTPRTDTSKRLPNSFKLVPLAFYLALVGGTYFMTMDWLAYKKAQQAKQQFEQVRKEHEGVSKQLMNEKMALDAETAKAEVVAKWVEGARNIQPISVAIARAMPPEVRISDLSIERGDQVPANLSLTLRINGGSATEVALVDSSITRLNYRSYSPQQSKNGDIIEYRSTLVRQEQ